jgi:hypothetical protein
MTYDKNIELQEKQKAQERKDEIVEKYIKKKNRIIGQYKKDVKVFSLEVSLLRFHSSMIEMETKLGQELRK